MTRVLPAQYHQYQVVGRHVPTEAQPEPEVFRMKLWALDSVKARSKFWYVGRLGRGARTRGSDRVRWGDYGRSDRARLRTGTDRARCFMTCTGISCLASRRLRRRTAKSSPATRCVRIPRHSESPRGGETRDARERRRGRRMTTRAGERRDQMARGVNSDIVCTPRGYGD